VKGRAVFGLERRDSRSSWPSLPEGIQRLRPQAFGPRLQFVTRNHLLHRLPPHPEKQRRLTQVPLRAQQRLPEHRSLEHVLGLLDRHFPDQFCAEPNKSLIHGMLSFPSLANPSRSFKKGIGLEPENVYFTLISAP
jgi:hypothetical protein